MPVFFKTVAERISNGAAWTKQKAAQAGSLALDKTAQAGSWAMDKANAGLNWANETGKDAVDNAVGATAAAIASAATKYKPVENCLVALIEDKNREERKQDGQYMGADCPQSSAAPPKAGRLPDGCEGCAGKFPKVVYTNGIRTSPDAACATIHKIANERCAEVVGVYNASHGFMQDVIDSKNNIDRAGREAAAHSQAELLDKMLNAVPPQRVMLYAHSQGGLIAQEALGEAAVTMKQSIRDQLLEQGVSPENAKALAAERTKAAMGRVDVYSFGTAEQDWPPVGARLHQFTNTADPVPKLLAAVQNNRGRTADPDNLIERHRFEKTGWNPTAPHSMDDTYLPELNQVHPVAKNANGKCC